MKAKVTKNVLCHAVTTQERLVLKKYYFDPYFCGYYTREVNKQERLMMARVRYVSFLPVVCIHLDVPLSISGVVPWCTIPGRLAGKRLQ